MPFDSRSAPFVEKPSQCRPQQEDIRSKESRMKLTNEKDVACKRISIYKGVSDRPLGWKPRRHQIKPQAGTARDANIRKFDGAEQTSSEWDALRKVSVAYTKIQRSQLLILTLGSRIMVSRGRLPYLSIWPGPVETWTSFPGPLRSASERTMLSTSKIL